MSYLLPSYPLVQSFTGNPNTYSPPQANIYLLKTDTAPPSLWYSTGTGPGDVDDITYNISVLANTDLNTILGTVNPSNSIGQNQNIYLNLSTAHYFVKELGVWVDYGEITGTIDGPQGDPGERGSSIQSVVGVPVVLGTEKQGDLVIDINTYDLYEYTTVWTLIGNIKGGQGDEGDPGERGNTIILNNSLSVVGIENDLLILTPSLSLYRYVSSNWVFQGVLKGDTGLGLTFRNFYSPVVEYTLNNIVRYQSINYIYTSNTPGTGLTPGVSSNWSEFNKDGKDIYTNTTVAFVQPGINLTVAVEVKDATIFSNNQIIYISNGGYYRVTNTNVLTKIITIENLNYSSNVQSGLSVPINSTVTPSGIKGEDGTQIYVEASLPSNLLGNEGDIYIYTDNSNLYEKVGGTWELKTVLGGYDYTVFNLFQVAINSAIHTPTPVNPALLVIDAEKSNTFNYILTDTPTNISVTNLYAGWNAKLRLVQDANGGNNIIFGSQFVYPGGINNVLKPSLIASRDIVYSLVSFDGVKVHIDGASINYS